MTTFPPSSCSTLSLDDFAKFALEDVALERRKVIHEEQPVAMVRLVDEASHQQSPSLHLKCLSAHVLRAQSDKVWSAQRRADAGERETGLVAVLLALCAEDQ